MRKTMSIVGGIIGYDKQGLAVRHEGGKAPFGRLVFYLDKNGLDIDRKKADKFFGSFQILEVGELYVHSSHSEVEFTTCPNEKFNSVMFEDLLPTDNRLSKTFANIHLNLQSDDYTVANLELEIKNILSSVYNFDDVLSNRIYKAAYTYGFNIGTLEEFIDKTVIALCAESMANYFKISQENLDE